MSGTKKAAAAAGERIVNLENEWKSINLTRVRQIKERRCIYRVPQFMKKLSPDSYTPQFVSLGPYHHGADHLKNGEMMKRKILGYYLKKINKTLRETLQVMRSHVQELMDAYADLEDSCTDVDSFAQLMVVDGCFLLAYLYYEYSLLDVDDPFHQCYERILGSAGYIISTEVYLLENQVPIRALNIMADLGGSQVTRLPSCTGESLHLLHFVLLSWIVKSNFLFKPPFDREVNPPTITELVEAGIHIETCEGTIISFEDGVLKLPKLTLVMATLIEFHNMIAFETLHKRDPEIYSFMDFMDCLIDRDRDVEILKKKGVIRSTIASDHDIADLFNKITRQTYPSERRFRWEGDDIAKSLSEYCGKCQHKWPACFKHLYLENPWAFILLIGAIFLLVLTLLRTVYTVLGYHHT